MDVSSLRSLPAAIFSLVFPDNCRVCRKPLKEISRVPVCSPCLRSPRSLVPEHFCQQCHTPFLNDAPLDAEGRCLLCRRGLTTFDRAWSFGEYSGSLRKLIHLFKYDGMQPLGRPLGVLLSRALPRTESIDVVVPMPLHWRRRWQRGFNQSEVLARALSARTGLPVADVVRRRRPTSAQAGLTGAQRRENVAGAFEVKKKISVQGRRVLLVDDVLTTGATAGACAAALRRAGATSVSVLTLARVDRRRGFAGRSIS